MRIPAFLSCIAMAAALAGCADDIATTARGSAVPAAYVYRLGPTIVCGSQSMASRR